MISSIIQPIIKPIISSLIESAGAAATYIDSVLADSPVIYIRGNTDDVGLDSSGNDYHMTENGVISSAVVSGFPESSVIDLSSMPDLPLRYTGNEISHNGDLTVEMWVKLEAQPASGKWFDLFWYGDLASEAEAGNFTTLYYYNSSGTKLIYGHERASGTDHFAAGLDTSLPLDTVFYLVMTRDVATKIIKFYVDGIEIGTAFYTAAPTGGSSATCFTTIGNVSSGAGIIDGYISSFAVYHTKLSTDRIAAHYNANGT